MSDCPTKRTWDLQDQDQDGDRDEVERGKYRD